MRTQARAVLIGACSTMALAFGAPLPASAASYDALLMVDTTTPNVGQTITATLYSFQPGEIVDITIDGYAYPLATLTMDENGGASDWVALPNTLSCAHTLTAIGQTTGEEAHNTLVIGPSGPCSSADGNLGTGNTGAGNIGTGNVGSGNIGNDNTGYGNVGNKNTGHGNSGSGNAGDGNTPYTSAVPYGASGYGVGPDAP